MLGFGSSTNLAAAYGIAVTGTMVITTILAYRRRALDVDWSLPASVALFGAFLLVDLGFFGANLLKVADGGWFPLVFGLRRVHADVDLEARPRTCCSRGWRPTRSRSTPSSRARRWAARRCPGTAVFMTTNLGSVPHALLHSLKHYKSLHEQVILLNAVTLDVPHVPPAQRVVVEPINAQFHKVKVFFGFMDDAGPARRARVVRASRGCAST